VSGVRVNTIELSSRRTRHVMSFRETPLCGWPPLTPHRTRFSSLNFIKVDHLSSSIYSVYFLCRSSNWVSKTLYIWGDLAFRGPFQSPMNPESHTGSEISPRSCCTYLETVSSFPRLCMVFSSQHSLILASFPVFPYSFSFRGEAHNSSSKSASSCHSISQSLRGYQTLQLLHEKEHEYCVWSASVSQYHIQSTVQRTPV